MGLTRPRARRSSGGQGAEFVAGLAGVPVDDVDELAGGAGVGVVGQVPDLAGGVGVFAEDGEAFADVGDVGVGVGLVGVAEHGGGLAGQGGGEDAVAEVGLGAAAGAEVVRGAADRDLDAAGVVGGEEIARHPRAELALRGVGVVGAVLGERAAGGAAVHVDVLHADQPGAGGFGGSEDAGLQGGELCGPLVVGRVEGLVDDGGAVGGLGGEGGVAGVAADDLDVVGYAGVAGAVDSRTVSPRRRRASKVARPMAPVPKMTCRAAVMLSPAGALPARGSGGCAVGQEGGAGVRTAR